MTSWRFSVIWLCRVSAPVCTSVWPCVFHCVCSLMTHSVLSCRQAESEEEEAMFVISAGCHSHGVFGCCHHQCNYDTAFYSRPSSLPASLWRLLIKEKTVRKVFLLVSDQLSFCDGGIFFKALEFTKLEIQEKVIQIVLPFFSLQERCKLSF